MLPLPLLHRAVVINMQRSSAQPLEVGIWAATGGDFASSVDLIPYTLPDGTSGTNVLVKADKYSYLLAADVPESR
jgi:hypothetical protein